MDPLIVVLAAIVFFVIVGLILSTCILTTKYFLVPSGPVKLTINEEKESEVSGGSTLLNVLLNENISVPAPCGGKATCHQCKVRVKEGGGDPLETEISFFTTKEIKEGWRLSCQCKVKESLKVEIPPSILSVNKFEAKVISNKNVATFIKELIVELPEGLNLEYIPGDYAQIYVPAYQTHTDQWKETMDEKYFPDWETFKLFGKQVLYKPIEDIARAYSIASYPNEGNILKFIIRIEPPPFHKNDLRRVPWGIGSAYAFSLQPGDTVTMAAPFGESHMIHDERDVHFLIGGAGASFGRSHILDLLINRNTERKVTLWYGARSLRENIYEEEFKKMEEIYRQFNYHVVLSEPLEEDLDEGWPKDDPIKTNYLYKAFEEGELKNHDAPEDCLYFVCGPPLHNKSVMMLLDDYGVPRESIVLDDFGS